MRALVGSVLSTRDSRRTSSTIWTAWKKVLTKKSNKVFFRTGEIMLRSRVSMLLLSRTKEPSTESNLSWVAILSWSCKFDLCDLSSWNEAQYISAIGDSIVSRNSSQVRF